MLAVVLTLGAMPVYGTFASAGMDDPTVETASETPAPSVEPDTPEPAAAPAPQGEPEAMPTPSAEVTPNQKPEDSPTPSETPTESLEPTESSPATYDNSISGMLWLDMFDDIGNSIYAGDGIRQSKESPLAGYTVELYKAEDKDNAIASTTTGTDGKYTFENIEPGSYVVGVKTTTMDGVEYLLPLFWLDGTTGDNRFVATYDASADAYLYAYTAAITVTEDSEVTGKDAAMRTVPQIQPMANTTYTIDLATVTTATAPAGTTFSGSVLTFTGVDSTDNYIITTSASTARYIIVSSGETVNMTLDGVTISSSTSPIRVLGTANVTLIGTNTLTCTGTSITAGTIQAGVYVPPSATLTIDGTGSLTATGGIGSAGIGGSYITASTSTAQANNGAGTITIEGCTVNATGGGNVNTYGGGAGIGGGGFGAGGTTTINGGIVTATGGNYGAGIGGGGYGHGGIITINDGTVTAFGKNHGAGIGGGGHGGGASITISGGTINATGGYGGAGIGAGGSAGNGTLGGTIIISGGTIIAKGGVAGSYYAAGIGGGAGISGSNAASGTNIFTGGSIYPLNNAGTVSVATNTTNGSTNGSTLLYMTTVTVVDVSNIPVADALVSVELPTYTYEAYTNASGIAYIWVPIGSTLFEAQHDAYGYGAETATVAANNTNAVTIVLGMRTTLSRTPNTIAFISTADPTPVTLNVKAENKDTGALKDIISAQWFRVETTDATAYSGATFSTGYSTASSTNKGDDTTNLVETAGGDSSEKNYTLPVSENGKYWVMVHYKDGLGVDRYQVKSIVIDNVYTPSTGNYKGINSGDSSTLYDEAIPSLTNASGDPLVGVAFELNSATTILTSTSDGTTPVSGTGASLTVNAKNLAPLWITSAPTSQAVSVTGTNLGTTTFNYTLNPLAITVQFNSQGGTPSMIANQYYMPTDTFGTLPTVARTGYNFDGWFTAAIGGTQVNATDTTGSHFASGSTATLYAQWTLAAFTITEKYVDASGNTLLDASSTPIPDTSQSITPGATYNGSAISITDYVCVGYKIGSATDTFSTATTGTSGDTTPTISSVAAEHTVWYIYAQEIGSIKIEKYAHDGTTLLPGAEFKLEKLTGPGGSVTSIVGSMTTGAGGNVTFANLPAGSYQITEMESPQGYELLTEPFEVTIPTDVTYAVGVTPTDTNYLYSTTSGSNVIYHYYDVTYKVSDQASIAMPSAGATGDFPPYALWGGGLILLASLGGGILWLKRRRTYAPKHG